MDYCDEPKPFGHWTRRHVAADPRCPYRDANSLQAALNNRESGRPQLKPIMRMYGTFLYAEADVERWFSAIAQWQREEPQRRAARRAEDEARQNRKTAEVMAQGALQSEILQAHQQAHAEHEAAREEWLQRTGGV